MEKLISMLDKAKRDDSGFTLVELLVVVAIIGVLVAIIVPVMGGQISEAEEAACDANVRTLESAAALYNAEEGASPTNLEEDLSPEYVDEIPECPITGDDEYKIENEVSVYCTHD